MIHTIIEKHSHKVGKSQFLFYLWFCSKYPDGVQQDKINYMMRDAVVDNYIRVLDDAGLVERKNIGSNYRTVRPLLD